MGVGVGLWVCGWVCALPYGASFAPDRRTKYLVGGSGSVAYVRGRANSTLHRPPSIEKKLIMLYGVVARSEAMLAAMSMMVDSQYTRKSSSASSPSARGRAAGDDSRRARAARRSSLTDLGDDDEFDKLISPRSASGMTHRDASPDARSGDKHRRLMSRIKVVLDQLQPAVKRLEKTKHNMSGAAKAAMVTLGRHASTIKAMTSAVLPMARKWLEAVKARMIVLDVRARRTVSVEAVDSATHALVGLNLWAPWGALPCECSWCPQLFVAVSGVGAVAIERDRQGSPPQNQDHSDTPTR